MTFHDEQHAKAQEQWKEQLSQIVHAAAREVVATPEIQYMLRKQLAEEYILQKAAEGFGMIDSDGEYIPPDVLLKTQ